MSDFYRGIIIIMLVKYCDHGNVLLWFNLSCRRALSVTGQCNLPLMVHHSFSTVPLGSDGELKKKIMEPLNSLDAL